MQPVVIVSACRTPVGSFGGALRSLSAADLGAVVLREAVRRAAASTIVLDEVIMGCVLQGGAGMNVARQAAIKAGVPIDTPAETVNRVCGSGLQSVVHAVEAMRAGYTRFVPAGGTESMSNAAYAIPSARWGARMANTEVQDLMVLDGLTDAMHSCHMGITAEAIAGKYGISREDQDAFAAESQRRAVEAIANGSFRDEIVPVEIAQKKGDAIRVDTDEYPRPGTTVEKLAALKPAFKKDGTVTAGNSSGLNDGAAACLVALEAAARDEGLTPMARVVSYATVGVEPMFMGMGPVPAVRKALDRAGLKTIDIDLFELNEAFAVQSIAVMRELDLDPAKVNVRGGAIALGHPIGASGARLLTTLIYALRQLGRTRGVASLCIGGGMGIAMVIELVT